MVLALGALSAHLGCSRLAGTPDKDGETGDTQIGDGIGIGDGDGDGDGVGDGDGDEHEGGWSGSDLDFSETDEPSGCNGGGQCNQIDILFVIDNSGTMGEEQLNLSAGLPLLVDELHLLFDHEGMPLHPDVNIMFTTTDVGHPECTPLEPDGYQPAMGAPQSQACTERIEDFTGLGLDAATFPEACTTGCPIAVEPVHAFIHMEGPMATVTNVPGNNIAGAMRCLAPQGINGCGYEAPLESMLQAIHPDATWNQGNKPFLREDAMLAIVIITDEEDCSVRAPEGYAYFTDPQQNTYWEVNPDTGTKTNPTSAVCWNAGVDCGAPDANGVYADCHSIDTGALYGTERYLQYLRDTLIADQHKAVVMLGILGVPHVTEHSQYPPYQPIQGGAEALVYHDWVDAPYPDGDIIDEGATAASKTFEFGIGPGCTSEDDVGAFTGQAIPPVRIKEVCQALDSDEQMRCCIESVCDSDYSAAMSCLAGMIQSMIAISPDPFG
jgi:hypothetical protein